MGEPLSLMAWRFLARIRSCRSFGRWKLYVVVFSALLQLPLLSDAALRNLGALLFARAALVARSAPAQHSEYPVRFAPPFRQALGRAANVLSVASRVLPPTPSTRWLAGRVALAGDDPKKAASLLTGLEPDSARHTLLMLDWLAAERGSGHQEAALDILEQHLRSAEWKRSRPPKPVRDAGAAMYLDKARSVRQADPELAGMLYEKVLDLRPGDLTATFHLWNRARAHGDGQIEEAMKEQLEFYPLTAIEPSAEGLGDEIGRTIFEIITSGIWDEEHGTAAVAYLVWRHNGEPWVERLAKRLAESNPARAVWPLLLAECYERREQWAEAADAYQALLKTHPECHIAEWHLGYIADRLGTERGDHDLLRRALVYFTDYRLSAPTDLAGLRSVVDTQRKLGLPLEADTIVAWSRAFDVDVIVGSLLGIPSGTSSRVGPRLGGPGRFDRWDDDGVPSRWRWLNQATGDISNRGLFAGGRDEYSGWEGPSLRISGLWLVRDRALNPGAFGVRPPDVYLQPDAVYVVSLLYRTARLADRAFNFYTSPSLEGRDLFLPSTNGEWRRFILVARRSGTAPSRSVPILRLRAPGDVWCDEFEMREVHLPASVKFEGMAIRVLP